VGQLYPLSRCTNGFHPTASDLTSLDIYARKMAQALHLHGDAWTTPYCVECTKPIHYSVCHYAAPPGCTHLYCATCMSLWQPSASGICPKCTNMPMPKMA